MLICKECKRSLKSAVVFNNKGLCAYCYMLYKYRVSVRLAQPDSNPYAE